jgi:hypothetical protein
MIKKSLVILITLMIITGILLFTGCPADSVPPVGCGNIIGSNSDNDDDNLVEGWLWAVSFSVSETQDINTLGIKFGTAGDIFGIGVFSNNVDKPGNLLAETGKKAISTGWNSASITTINLTAGITYWIVGTSDLNGTLRSNSASGVSVKKLLFDYSASVPLPSNEAGWATDPAVGDVKIYTTLVCP